MRVAIFHDYFDDIGGAELVVLALARHLNATVITTNIDRDKIFELNYGDVKFVSLGQIPQVAHLKQVIAKWKFFRCNFSSQFDFFILGNHCSIFTSKKHKSNLWYCFSPGRGLYDLRTQYFKGIGFLVWPGVKLFIFLDKYFVSEIKDIIAISHAVRTRVKKYYNQESIVVHPPVQTESFYYTKNGDYWLSVNRLVPHKRVDLQLKAFAELPREKLLIVGGFKKLTNQYIKYLNDFKPSNVEILHWVSQEKLIDLYANCKGFITTSIEEDFGMTAIEAMASGKPVIAPNEGGYKETVIDGQTGILIDNINEDKIVEAVKKISDNLANHKDTCLLQAKKFDQKIFFEKIKEFIKIA